MDALETDVGTDIVSVTRIAALVEARGTAFLDRWFTPLEIDYCTRMAEPSRHFAARIAAKEAVSKALPVSWEGPLPWRSIEIVSRPDGSPSVTLSGALREAADQAGVRVIKVSLSHCDDYATAVALATSDRSAG